MTNKDHTKKRKLSSVDQIISLFEGYCNTHNEDLIGVESEKFLFTRNNNLPIVLNGDASVQSIFAKLSESFGWEKEMEGKNITALKRSNASLTLEPGLQIELSGAPMRTVHDIHKETTGHKGELQNISREFGIGVLSMGSAPFWSLEQMPKLQKPRYVIMRRHFDAIKSHGIRMMHQCCTHQVNVDYSSEKDMIAKFRTSIAVQPVISALFANSSISDGADSGMQSVRSSLWSHTDPDRTGIPTSIYEDDFSFASFIDLIISVPIIFIEHEGKHISIKNSTFKDFLNGKLPEAPGLLPCVSDFELHLSLVFPEVRPKRVMEMRGTDAGPAQQITSLAALWTGLLYDMEAFGEVTKLFSFFSPAQIDQLHTEYIKNGLHGSISGVSIQELARDVIAISERGLKRRAHLDTFGRDESQYLDYAKQICKKKKTLSDVAKKILADAGDQKEAIEKIMDVFRFDNDDILSTLDL